MILIPTSRQWRKWSLPSKLTAVGCYLAVLAILLTVVFYVWPRSGPLPPTTKIQAVRISSSAVGQVVQGNVINYKIECTPEAYMAIVTNLALTATVLREALELAGKTNVPPGEERSQLALVAKEYKGLKSRILDAPVHTDADIVTQRGAIVAMKECDLPRARQLASMLPDAPISLQVTPTY